MTAIQTYEATQQYGAEDHGFANTRRVSVDHIRHYQANSWGGNTGYGNLIYWKETVMPNPPLCAPVSKGGAGIGRDRPSMYTNPEMADWSPDDLVRWAIGVYNSGPLNGMLTAEERNPSKIPNNLLGDLDDGNSAKLFTVTGTSYADAYRKFNKLAMDKKNDKFGYNLPASAGGYGGRFNPEIYCFGDGLALVPPTPELVNEMLAATTRGRNEILGKMKMRAGIITVEKCAINAVMAGAKPEYFPVILAAMEAYSNGFNNGKMYYHAMSTGGLYGFALVISGPIVKELEMKTGMGVMGAGNTANDTIGRAVRMCIRNIGHNRVPNIDTTGRVGKQDDHTLTVVAENMDELALLGWKSHSEMMGFPAGSSTISMAETGSNWESRKIGGEPFAWTYGTNADGLLPRIIRGWQGASAAGFLVIPPGVASVLVDEGMTSKELVKEWLATHTNTGATGTGLNRSAVWPIVAGDNPGYMYSLQANFGGRDAYQTQLITGAVLTDAGKGRTPPSEPRNFNVVFSPDRTEATLTWNPPARIEGTLLGYQATATDGGETFRATSAGFYATPSNQGILWNPRLPDTNGEYMKETTCKFTNLNPDAQYFFRVRAVTDLRNAAEVVGVGNPVGSVFAPNDFNWRDSGTGAVAMWSDPAKLLNRAVIVPGKTDADAVFVPLP
ncbi:MAG: fibronectin type III domain-containing protein [Oscillospiraceae bacterium]|jgi:hypothetical protein|nr:fibronectin type III domain-containing protein [Oscillospiraceae bacterium]